jgi:DNA-binding NtrC family response regulator
MTRNGPSQEGNIMKKLKILVVDDELDMRTFITTLLETSGYRPIIRPGRKSRRPLSWM